MDYRRLNEVTRKNTYSLPCTDMTLNMAGSQWFSTLDLVSRYWQVEVAEEDQTKTAFCTDQAFEVPNYAIWILQCPCYLPVRNGPHPGWTQLSPSSGLSQWHNCPVAVFLGTPTEQMIFARLCEAGLKLKPAKCALFG